MRRVFLVRHGQTDMNAQRIVQGPRLDPPLNEKGRTQARALARRLLDEGLTAVFTSPMLRARQTAQAIADVHGLTPQILAGLTEYDWGAHCGRNESGEVAAAMKRVFDRWWTGDVDARSPEGESAREAAYRVRAAFATALAASDGDVAIVAHGRINKILLASLLAEDLTKQEDFPQYNTGLTLLELDATPDGTAIAAASAGARENLAPGSGGPVDPAAPPEAPDGGRAAWVAGREPDPAAPGRWRLVYVNDTSHREGVDIAPGAKVKETNA